ncbi:MULTISPECIES: hypothetical protein [unclassified Sinorhizobium]|uniref:hypothetical protein n=1 Tax=unclassified Sinorhizobium TaxID=2613772 RepID=UPI003523B08E
MGRLHRFFRLSERRKDLETMLLIHEYRALLVDDQIDDGSETELRTKLGEVSDELLSLWHRPTRRNTA